MKCKCGCNKKANCKNGFCHGHWNKNKKRPDLLKRNIENNPMKNPEIAKRAGIKPDNWEVWNKGLTINNDERIKNYSEKRNKNLVEIGKKISETKKERYKTGQIKSYWKGRKRTEEFKEKMRIATLKRIERQGTYISYNEKSIPFFKEINEKYALEGLYGRNKFKCKGYSLDFYSKKYNLVIEWDEEGHYKNEKLLQKDIKRQNIIRKHLDCTFIRIRESKINKKELNQTIKTITNE